MKKIILSVIGHLFVLLVFLPTVVFVIENEESKRLSEAEGLMIPKE